uniref:Aspartate--tRNA(Asp/Asn) ligase n=1 Tax=Stylophora pistillata TaxID=50429 RepID=A0A2B4RZ87_STYPI
MLPAGHSANGAYWFEGASEVFGTLLMSAQNQIVRGVVTDTNKQALAGVSVMVKGSSIGTATGVDGTYQIGAVKGATLVFKMMGFFTKEVVITSEKISVRLKENAQSLQNILVEGHLNQNLKAVSSSRMPVKAVDMPTNTSYVGQFQMEEQMILKPSEVFQNVAGVYQFNQGYGGSGETVGIRGVSLRYQGNMFRNGLRMGANQSGATPEMLAFEAVEIHKGASAINFGYTSIGGAINYVTKKPTFKTGGAVIARMAQYGLFKNSFDLNVKVSDRVGLRFIGTVEDAGSFRETLYSKRRFGSLIGEIKTTDRSKLSFNVDYLYDKIPRDFGIPIFETNVQTGTKTVSGKTVPVYKQESKESDVQRLWKGLDRTRFIGSPFNDRVTKQLNANLRYDTNIFKEKGIFKDWKGVLLFGLSQSKNTYIQTGSGFRNKYLLLADGDVQITRTLEKGRVDDEYSSFLASLQGSSSTANFDFINSENGVWNSGYLMTYNATTKKMYLIANGGLIEVEVANLSAKKEITKVSDAIKNDANKENYLMLYNDYIYYNNAKENKIYRVKKDGTAKELFIEGDFNDLITYELADKIFQDVAFSSKIPANIEEEVNKERLNRAGDKILEPKVDIGEDIGTKTGLENYRGVNAVKINKDKVFLSDRTILDIGFEWFSDAEREQVNEVLETGVLMRYGFDGMRKDRWKAKELEAALCKKFGVGYAQLTSSGTTALSTAMAVLGVGAGDEVIMPSFTFVASFEAIIAAGATPVVVDIDDSLTLCPKAVENAITSRTKAVMPVHMCGAMADLDPLKKLCKKHGLYMIEDACQAIGGTYKGAYLGTIADMGTFSFDFVKTITCGEGGVVLTNDQKWATNADAYTDHGHDHIGNDRGAEQHPYMGYNFRISELHAAVGLAQLGRLDQIIVTQRSHKKILKDALATLPEISFRRLPDPSGDNAGFLSFFLPDADTAQKTMDAFADHKIDACWNYFENNWHYIRRWEHLKRVQSFRPIIPDGKVECFREDGTIFTVDLEQVHLEEDAAKLMHETKQSLVDFNKAGVPLIEIVTTPCIRSIKDAATYAQYVHRIVQNLGISDANLEKGEFKSDVSVSLRKKGTQDLNPRTEIKNLNSFKFMIQALEEEVQKQLGYFLENGDFRPDQTTVLWDEALKKTQEMRKKEYEADYRFITEPDLPFVRIAKAVKNTSIQKEKLPFAVEKILIDGGVLPKDAKFFTSDPLRSDAFSRINEVLKQPAFVAKSLTNLLKVEDYERIKNIDAIIAVFNALQMQKITSVVAGGAVQNLLENPEFDYEKFFKKNTVDASKITETIENIIAANAQISEEIKNGNQGKAGVLVGKVMGVLGKGVSGGVVRKKILEMLLEGGAKTTNTLSKTTEQKDAPKTISENDVIEKVPMVVRDHYRTHLIKDITEQNLGTVMELSGWVSSVRDHGELVFIDLREADGSVLQVRLSSECFPNLEALVKLKPETVIAVKGTLVLRGEEDFNPSIKTGKWELQTQKLEVLNLSKTLPFEIKRATKTNEQTRFQYKFLDHRNTDVRRAIVGRHKVIKLIRDFLDSENFLEIETPILTAGTDEGAREFIVPSRKAPGSFYTLPQAPQQFKQMLMVGGFDRYFQIARCFRDEDSRGDRQPEFTQLDLEMSYASMQDIIQLNTDIFNRIVKEIYGKKWILKPIQTITYKEAMDKYGCDRPDIRFGLPMQDITAIVQETEFQDGLNIGYIETKKVGDKDLYGKKQNKEQFDSPKYREKYRDFLKTDFPRVPYPNQNKEKFWNLVKLGAERGAIDIFNKELSIRRNEALDRLLELSNNENESDSVERRIARALGENKRYTLPVRDALKYADDLYNYSQSDSEFSHIADKIEENILKGKLFVSKEGKVFFKHNKLKSQKAPLDIAASAIKSVAKLVFFMRHTAKKGMALFIDEPELNLHPDNQVLIARVLVQIANSGIKLFVSTHSDYIVREFNNMIIADQVKDEKYYSRETYLNKKDIAVTRLFYKQDKNRQVTSEKVLIENDGFTIESVDETIEDQEYINGELLENLE